MTTRQTSIDCYNQIKAEGLLSKRRMQVYEVLFKHGAMTANEIVRILQASYPNTNSASFNSRLSELKRAGVVIEVGEKKDIISNKNCYVWDLTDNLPKDLKPSTDTKKLRMNDALNALRQLYKKKNKSTVEEWKNVADLIKKI